MLHHVVPGAFKAADLKAGDEMTGVSLAGTQLRANLYARQLYDNRWNDIEVHNLLNYLINCISYSILSPIFSYKKSFLLQ